MEVLKVKFEQNRAEVLKHLDVSKDLLEVMTRHGLVDIADCVKYQGIYDVKKRNGSLMKTMVERRTERAYPLFINSLRQTGQDSVANLLTDIGEETRILTHLQAELEQEIGAITDYIKTEERRSGVASKGGGGRNCEHDPQPHLPPAPTSDREVWVGVQATLKRATAQFERCRAVIDKLHQDCQDLATANGDMVLQIRGCYGRVKRMLRPGHDPNSPQEVPKSTQAMFQSLIEDVEKLMNRKSKAQQQENEGRTTAMRMLRHLRDWIQERSSILDTLHASTSGSSPRVNRLPMLSSRKGTSLSNSAGGFNHTSSLYRYPASRQQTPSPTRSQAISEDSNPALPFFGGDAGQSQDRDQGASHVGTAVEGESGTVAAAEHVRHVEPHAISTVLEGLNLLEQQVRQYVHMEILLTDKYRSELRYRHLRKRSQGYTPKGLDEASRALQRLESGTSKMGNSISPGGITLNGREGMGEGDSRLHLIKLRSCFDAMCEEYNSCATYMSRISNALLQFPDVDAFLAHMDDQNGKQAKNSKKQDKDKKNRHTAADHEKPGHVFSLFSNRKKNEPTGRSIESSRGLHSQGTNLPTIVTPAPSHYDEGDLHEDGLLQQLKQLVANYELVKQKLNRLEDRFRREYDNRRRAFDATLRDRDEEIRVLHIRLKEMEAEKDKYRGLYDKMKVAHSRKR